ncbi:hypothetical protein D3C79_627420 [compost metagenome]
MINLENGHKKYTLNKTWEGSSEYFYWLQNNNNISFFKEIPAENIKSIFLGYRYPIVKENEVLEKARKDNSRIKNCKIYKMTLCPFEFKLKPKEIYPNNEMINPRKNK